MVACLPHATVILTGKCGPIPVLDWGENRRSCDAAVTAEKWRISSHCVHYHCNRIGLGYLCLLRRIFLDRLDIVAANIGRGIGWGRRISSLAQSRWQPAASLRGDSGRFRRGAGGHRYGWGVHAPFASDRKSSPLLVQSREPAQGGYGQVDKTGPAVPSLRRCRRPRFPGGEDLRPFNDPKRSPGSAREGWAARPCC